MPKVKKEALEKDEFSHFNLNQIKEKLSLSKSRREKIDDYQWQINYGHVEHRDKLKKEKERKNSPKKQKTDTNKVKSYEHSVSVKPTQFESPEKSDEYNFTIVEDKDNRKQVGKLVSSPALILRNEPNFEKGQDQDHNETPIGDRTRQINLLANQ